MSGAPAAVLITAAWLGSLLEYSRRITLLDVRWRLGGPPGRELYAAGHLPGAVFTDLNRDLAAPPGRGGRHPLPAAAEFEAAMRAAGVRRGGLVVVYDDADSTAAARAWWLLRYFGHPEVLVLDGGFRAWTAAGLPVAPPAIDPPAAAGDFTARPGQLPLLDADDAAALAHTGLLLDARAGERYRGETEPVDPVAGHIPGAVSAPTADNVNPDGTFRPPAELAARFAALGVPGAPVPGVEVPDAEVPGAEVPGAEVPDAGVPGAGVTSRPAVGIYCGSGVTAAHEILALNVAGVEGAALYVGSWSSWITDPARPVATGPKPG